VFLKLTGLPACSRAPYPYSDLRAPVRELLDRFGTRRCFWASDLSFFQGQVGWANRFPVLVGEYPGKHTYAQAVGFWRDAEWLTHDERDRLLGATVRAVLAWPEAEAS
jgi:predicted TIM-barrel fold metal-dependent hydrolase